MACTRTIEEKDPSIRLRRLRLSTGPELRVAERGPEDGPAVLALHGYSDSWVSVTPSLAYWPRGWRVVAPDQRGHGESERPADGYTPARLADDAAALLDALGVARATVVGHSMGGLVAQRMAVAHPERVERLVLVGTGAAIPADAVAGLAREVDALEDPVPEAFVRAFQESSLHRRLPEALFERLLAEACVLPARVWRAALRGLAGFDGTADLDRIACPTLLVWGARDAFFDRASQEVLRRGIRNLVWREYPETGHAPNWERPEAFARDLAAFVGGPGGLAPGRTGLV